MSRETVLVISDTHIPYGHPETLKFLKKLKEAYKPDKVIHIGDLVDFHAISMHDHDPDLPSPSDEFKRAKKNLKKMIKLFPKMDLIIGNHDELPSRRAKKFGMPSSMIKHLHDILGLPKTWKWHKELIHDGVLYTHGHRTSSIPMKTSKNRGLCTVEGHFHTRFSINYWSAPFKLYWGMQVGCLIDDKSMAMEYNKRGLERPIIGTGVIIDGHPHLVPMVLKQGGKWDGKLR